MIEYPPLEDNSSQSMITNSDQPPNHIEPQIIWDISFPWLTRFTRSFLYASFENWKINWVELFGFLWTEHLSEKMTSFHPVKFCHNLANSSYFLASAFFKGICCLLFHFFRLNYLITCWIVDLDTSRVVLLTRPFQVILDFWCTNK